MTTKNIRVVDRGSFFDDGFFKDSWADFDTAMRTVLDRYGGSTNKNKDSSGQECQDLYRKVRQNEIGDDIYASQAILVTEKNGRFQVVMDVKDFNPRDLQVRVVDERIKVEGRFDQVSEDGKSSTSKAFYKEFTLPPQADIDQLSTALSKDGVLTIKAPKKEGVETPTPSITNEPQTPSMDSMQKDFRDRLGFSDKDSGRSSYTGSPIPSMYSTTSCGSPAPSEAWSTATDQDRYPNPYSHPDMRPDGYPSQPQQYHGFMPQMSPLARDPNLQPQYQMPYNMMGQPPNYGPGPFSPRFNQGPPPYGTPDGTPGYAQTPQSFHYPQRPQGNYGTNVRPNDQSMMQARPEKPLSQAALGSGGTATISVKEDDGKRTMTQETTSLVQEKDGFLQSKEVNSETKDKDSQAARREAVTRMSRQEEDKDGRFKRSETADASDVNESCVRTLPDGSVMTVKKSSTSSSNFKTSYSSAAPGMMGFPIGFGDSGNFMPQQVMPNMSSDSLSSGSSNFSDMTGRFHRMEFPGNMPDMFSNRMPMFPEPGFMRPANQFGGQNNNFSSNYSTSYSHSSSNAFDNKRNQN